MTPKEFLQNIMDQSAFVVTDADYVSGLTVTGPDPKDGSKTVVVSQIPNKYVATGEAAARLQVHLRTLGLNPSLTMDYPLGHFVSGGPFQQSGMAPFFDFPHNLDGSNTSSATNDHENVAGLLQMYQVLGVAGADALMQKWFTPQVPSGDA